MTTSAEDNSLWIRRFHPRPDSEARLVCLPHAGGSASFFFPMSAAVSPSLDVLSVQYPGRQDRRAEPCVASIQELADRISVQLLPWTDRPLMIFGHSMGATIGFEVASRLEREHGVVLAGLFASGRRAPSRKRHETVHQRDDRGIIAELQQLSGTNSKIMGDEEMLRMVLPAIRADYRAAETYTYEPRPKLHCPIVGLVGDDDPKVTLEEARAWSEHTEGGFDLQVFPGGHFYLASHQSEIVNAVSDHMLAQLRLKPAE